MVNIANLCLNYRLVYRFALECCILGRSFIPQIVKSASVDLILTLLCLKTCNDEGQMKELVL